MFLNISVFVNGIFLYDDRITITFNVNNNEVTINDDLLNEIESKADNDSLIDKLSQPKGILVETSITTMEVCSNYKIKRITEMLFFFIINYDPKIYLNYILHIMENYGTIYINIELIYCKVMKRWKSLRKLY